MIILPHRRKAFRGGGGGGSGLLTDLVSWWDMSASSGNEPDQHGANDLTDNGGITYHATNGPGSKPCRLLDGTDDFFVGGDYAEFNAGSWTLAGWFYKTSGDCIYEKGTALSAASYTFLFYDESSSTDQFYTSNGSAAGYTTWLGTVRNGWCFAALTFDSATNAATFSNPDYSSGSRTVTGGLVNEGGSFAIGRGLVYGDKLNGRVGPTGLWTRVLTSGEITELYNSGNGLSYADL
jgi:hypothetical protein